MRTRRTGKEGLHTRVKQTKEVKEREVIEEQMETLDPRAVECIVKYVNTFPGCRGLLCADHVQHTLGRTWAEAYRCVVQSVREGHVREVRVDVIHHGNLQTFRTVLVPVS